MKRLLTFCFTVIFIATPSLSVSSQMTRQPEQTKRLRNAEPISRFESVEAITDGAGVVVKWRMGMETGNAGFLVYRMDDRGTHLVSKNLIHGAAMFYGQNGIAGEDYSFFDSDGRGNSSYFIQNVSMTGGAAISDTVAVQDLSYLPAEFERRTSGLAREIAETKKNSSYVVRRPDLPKELYKEVAANQVNVDANQHAWVIAQPGVKIGVRQEGIYRVTKAELQSAGFDTNSNSANWQLYREGVEQAISVGTNGDNVDFYAKGIDTPESDMAVYFLVVGPSAGKRMATKVARPVSGSVTSKNYFETNIYKQRTSYLNQVLNGDAENYWGQSITTYANTTINFQLTGVDQNVAEASMELKFQGYSFDNHIVQVSINGHALNNATGISRAPFSKQYLIPTSYLQEGTNSLVLRSAGVTSDFSLFDSVSIGYSRSHVADQNKIKFYTQNYRLANVDGFASSDIKVFDITNAAAPETWTNLTVVPNGPSYRLRLPSDRGRFLYAVETSGMKQAAEITANDPAMLSTTSNAADLVIISHRNWMDEAEDWADYRRQQGVAVKVVEVSEIYDEFNFGDLSSVSIRSFLNYAHNNWQTPPQYVLLLGDSSFDSRNYQGLGYNNYVPTHIVNTVFTETGSDDWLADFNGDGLADMAIGRITARDGATVSNVLAKTISFEQNAPTPENQGILFAFDTYDAANNYDFQAMSNQLKNQLPGGVPVDMVGRSDVYSPPATPQSVLVGKINEGKYLVNFSGHGTTGAWGHSSFFANSTVTQLTNANDQSIFTMLTCLNGYFLHASSKSLAENLVESTTGGAVAAWASTGETTPDVQMIMANRFFQKAGYSMIERLGDLVNDAKTTIPGGTDVRLSWALIGDPMLKVATPSPTKGTQQIRLRK